MRKILKKENGITLIALIITIIVLLILSGISIATLSGDNGILKQAGESKIKTKKAQIEEEIRLAYSAMQINNYEKEWQIDEKAEGLEKELRRIDSSAAVGVNGTDLKILYKGYETTISENGIMGDLAKADGVTMLNGDGQTYYTLVPTILSFRSSADIDDFQEVQINGVTLDHSNYSITEGSTIITLSIDYLKSLAEGDYSISIVSKTGSSSAGFSVVKPEVNNHGFYYNQPYAAHLPAFGGNTAFFVREDGTYDIITVGKSPSTGKYSVSGNNISVIDPLLGTITCTISIDGTEIYCNELATNFVLGGESFAADEDYIYTYDSSLGGYEVEPIDETKASYDAIRTGINGYPTVRLANGAFCGNVNLTVAPVIPNSVTSIGEDAFSGCDGLSSIKIPASVTSIDGYAFSVCTNLTSIIYEGTQEQWNNIAFGEYWNKGVPATSVTCSDGMVIL